MQKVKGKREKIKGSRLEAKAKETKPCCGHAVLQSKNDAASSEKQV
jgi:hypothetical protein